MKMLFKFLVVLCAVIGVYFMAVAAMESSSRKHDDRLHIAQLKGLLPFGRLSRKREAYDGEEIVAKKIADYRDEEDDDYLEESNSIVSAVTARLPRKVKHADPVEQKRISRLRKAAGATPDALDVTVEWADEEAQELKDDAAEITEDKLEELLDD